MPTIKGIATFIGEQSLDIVTILDPFGTLRGLGGAAGFESIATFRTPTEQLGEDIFGTTNPEIGMGLISSLLQFGSKLIAGAAPVAQRAVAAAAPAARAAISGTGRALAGRTGIALAGGGAAGALAISAFDGDGAVPAGAAQGLPEGTTLTQLSGGGFVARGPQGGMRILNRNGRPVKPSRIIPFGERLPGGAKVVAINAAGTQIGITIRRPRRTFSAEINRVRKTIRAADRLQKALRPAKRRRL